MGIAIKQKILPLQTQKKKQHIFKCVLNLLIDYMKFLFLNFFVITIFDMV
jgi:hypothetical protein